MTKICKLEELNMNMFSTDDIKKKRAMYERKIEDMLLQFEKELPSAVRIENMVATRLGSEQLKCGIKLVVEDLNN
jgi:hypothetical protein